MKSNIQIRKANSSHKELITSLAVQTFLESHGHSASKEDVAAYVQNKLTVKQIESELNDPVNLFHLIYVDDELAGYSKIIPDNKCEFVEANNISKMERLYVLEKYYGQKLGKQLMDYNIELAKSHKQTGLWLYTWTENQRAINFYQQIGFKIVGKADFQISANHSNPNHIFFLGL